MYRRRTPGTKRDPARNWALPDRVFFACGACHILAHAFIATYRGSGFEPFWIRPIAGHTGNHVVVVRGGIAFDYHGYSRWSELFAHMKTKANRFFPGWDADVIPLPADVLVSEAKSRSYPGLWLREPGQFLHDATPRAERYIARFPPPAATRST